MTHTYTYTSVSVDRQTLAQGPGSFAHYAEMAEIYREINPEATIAIAQEVHTCPGGADCPHGRR